MKAVLGVLACLVLSGCFVVGGAAAPAVDGQVPAGPLGPIIENPEGGPPIECRGVPRDQCLSFGNVEADPAEDPNKVVRTIVTCLKVCTPQRGDVRIDVLMVDGTVLANGQGGYESAGPVATAGP